MPIIWDADQDLDALAMSQPARRRADRCWEVIALLAILLAFFMGMFL